MGLLVHHVLMEIGSMGPKEAHYLPFTELVFPHQITLFRLMNFGTMPQRFFLPVHILVFLPHVLSQIV